MTIAVLISVCVSIRLIRDSIVARKELETKDFDDKVSRVIEILRLHILNKSIILVDDQCSENYMHITLKGYDFYFLRRPSLLRVYKGSYLILRAKNKDVKTIFESAYFDKDNIGKLIKDISINNDKQ
jgi:hypothetical protein